MLALSALLLVAAALVVWFVAPAARAAARLQLRFAAILFVAPAIAAIATPWAGTAVALIGFPIALAVLALASTAGFERALAPSLAAPLLAAVCLGALAAAVSGIVLLALVPAALATVAIAAVSLRRFEIARPESIRGMASALSFFAAASAFALEGAGVALLLFSAVGLLGLSLALARSDAGIEEASPRDLRVAALAVRRRRRQPGA
jgi:hypothetical protein